MLYQIQPPPTQLLCHWIPPSPNPRAAASHQSPPPRTTAQHLLPSAPHPPPPPRHTTLTSSSPARHTHLYPAPLPPSRRATLTSTQRHFLLPGAPHSPHSPRHATLTSTHARWKAPPLSPLPPFIAGRRQPRRPKLPDKECCLDLHPVLTSASSTMKAAFAHIHFPYSSPDEGSLLLLTVTPTSLTHCLHLMDIASTHAQ